MTADATAGALPDLVMAGMPWMDAVRRGGYMPSDRLLEAVLRDRRVERVLVANPYRSGPVMLARRLSGHPPSPPLPPAPGRAQWTPGRVRRRDPSTVRGVERAQRRYGHRLSAVAMRGGLDRPALVTADPFTAAFAELGWARSVTYYAWDDWAAHPSYRRFAAVYPVAEDRIRRRRVRVAAVSRAILDRLRPSGPSVVVPNAVEPAEWDRPDPPPAWFAELARPRFVYVGTIDERLDVAALLALARRRPDATIVLVGPHGAGDGVAALAAAPGISIHGPVGRRQVAAVVRAADVALLPHRHTDLTNAMSPLKLYEYLAAGRPVVATDLPPIRDVHPSVELVRPGGSLVEPVERALASGPLPEPERRRFAREHSWADRVDSILSLACTTS